VSDREHLTNAIILAHTAPAPEQVSEAIIKQLFRNDLNAAARLIARQSVTAALTVWREQLLRKHDSDLADAKREAHDQMMRADELRLELELQRAK
jgi:superfamily II DNA helicase RecQ